MKKITAFILMVVFVGTVCPAMAMTPDEEKKAHFEEMKKVKDAQRTEREAEKKNAPAAGEKKPGFWEKEGKRSGLSNMANNGSALSSVLQNLNPAPFFKDQQERYKARKAAAQK